MNTFEKTLVRAIMRANLNGDFSAVKALVAGTVMAKEMAYHGYKIIQVLSRAYARRLVNDFWYDGQQPVVTMTEMDGEVYEASPRIKEFDEDYYACVRASVESKSFCFFPHFEQALEERGLTMDFSGERITIRDPFEDETVYERMALECGYA